MLDIAIQEARRSVNQTRLSPPDLSGDGGSANIEFDFFDYKDGALIRVLTTGRAESIALKGDIIGMPAGVICTNREPAGKLWSRIAVPLFVLAEIVCLGAAAFAFKSITGSWQDIWVLVLPVLAAILPIVGAVFVDEQRANLSRGRFRRRLYPAFSIPGGFGTSVMFDFPTQLMAPTSADSDGETESKKEEVTSQ